MINFVQIDMLLQQELYYPQVSKNACDMECGPALVVDGVEVDAFFLELL